MGDSLYVDKFSQRFSITYSWIDIIALLVTGVLFLSAFICWQWYLERVDNLRQRTHSPLCGMRLPPPIMKLSLWCRANGGFAAMMIIAFMSSSAFIGWTFWIQVQPIVKSLLSVMTDSMFEPSFTSNITYCSHLYKLLSE
jgi:hypothetical protein